MALDGAFLFAVKNELKILINSRADKIYQPLRDEIIINFRTQDGAKKLLISASSGSARVHITENTIENPQSPPMFCMLLRKHLSGGRLIEIRQTGLERILFFDFECTNELGDKGILTLAAEVMGKYSNVILVNSGGKIIDSLKRVDAQMSEERMILPGMNYELPKNAGKISFLDANEQMMLKCIKEHPNKELSKSIVKAFQGVSPTLAREWEYYAYRGASSMVSEMTDEIESRLLFIIKNTKAALLNMECNYTVVKTKDGLLKDFSFIELRQYGNQLISIQMESAFKILDYFYSERDNSVRLKQKANDLFKMLVNTSARIEKRIAAQKDELIQCGKKDLAKLYGDLISANIYRIQKGDKHAELENFYEVGSPKIKIKLDEKLSPAQNAQRYYGEYRKSCTAEKKLAEQIIKGEDELKYIDSVFEALTRASTESEIASLRLELAEEGYVRLGKLKGKMPKEMPPLKFTSSDGYTILAGRNNKQNDKLSMKTAQKSDIWLHAQNIAGSHVIIITNGEMPPERTIDEAAVIAAYHSKAKNSSQVPVDYLPVKHLKKPVGAKPGMVIFTHNKTLYVNPDAELIDSLKADLGGCK